jgi:hypothetical protein
VVLSLSVRGMQRDLRDWERVRHGGLLGVLLLTRVAHEGNICWTKKDPVCEKTRNVGMRMGHVSAACVVWGRHLGCWQCA